MTKGLYVNDCYVFGDAGVNLHTAWTGQIVYPIAASEPVILKTADRGREGSVRGLCDTDPFSSLAIGDAVTITAGDGQVNVSGSVTNVDVSARPDGLFEVSIDFFESA